MDRLCVNVKNEASGRPERVDLLGRLGRPFLVHDPEVWFQELCLSYAAPSCRRGGQHCVERGGGAMLSVPCVLVIVFITNKTLSYQSVRQPHAPTTTHSLT